MANESTAAAPVPADPALSPSWAALSAADRSRLMQCFRTGTQAAGNAQYAIDMFSACVIGDPGNAVFVQAFLAALRRKYGAKKSGTFASLLSVGKTITAGKGLMGRGGNQTATTEPAKASDRRAELTQSVRDNPADVDGTLELADLFEQDGRIDEAEKLLTRALAASGNELKVREHVEDRQLRWAKSKVMIAEQRLAASDTPENHETVDKLKRAQLRQELEIFGTRCSRYPENLTWKYELALRLKAAGKFPEAIRHFQEALKDVRRKGAISLELGECFQSIKQYPLAMQNYEAAVEVLTDRELELRKRALYRAGVLAAGLKDRDAAQKHLSAVAGLDYAYRDVAERLDKLRSAKDNGGSDG